MRYDFKCEETGETTFLELPMGSDVPQSVKKDKKIFHRVWGCAITIPWGWGDTNHLNFNKSPSEKKHFY
jgi:hypothetical protein